MKRFGIRGMTAGALFLCMAMVVSTVPAFAWVEPCPLTQGFWKNHPNDWPVLTLEIGGASYTQDQLLLILDTPPSNGNAVFILVHQLIATDLNLANNSAKLPAITATIDDANRLVEAHCPNLLAPITECFAAASTAVGTPLVNDATVLDAYNGGSLTPSCTPATFPG